MSVNGTYIANQQISSFGFRGPHRIDLPDISKGSTFTIIGQLKPGILQVSRNAYIKQSDLKYATKKSSSADGYSYDIGGSATNWLYPVLGLGVGLGVGFLAGRHFSK